MKEREKRMLKSVKNKKKLVILAGVMLVVVIAVCVVIVGNDGGTEKESSSKKNMLEKYENKMEKHDEMGFPKDVSYDSNAYRNAFLIEENDMLMSLYKAAIDFAMENKDYDGCVNNESYWLGVQKGVARLYGHESVKDEIVIEKYDGTDWYKVSKSTVENIGLVLWNVEIPDWSDSEVISNYVKYDSKNDIYYFKITNPIDYCFTNLYSDSRSSSEKGGEVIYSLNVKGTTTLSKHYVEAYSVKDYAFQISYPSDNRFGFTILSLEESKNAGELSLFQFNSNTYFELDAEKLVNIPEYMDIFFAPYAYYREKCEDENEAIWCAVYNAIYEYYIYTSFNGVILEDNENADSQLYVDSVAEYINKIIEFYGYPELFVDGDTDYLHVSENFVKDFADVCTGKKNLKKKAIPDYLEDLIAYDEENSLYEIKIDDNYIVNLSNYYAPMKLDEGAYRVYCTMYKEEEERTCSFYLIPSEYNNYLGVRMDFMEE